MPKLAKKQGSERAISSDNWVPVIEADVDGPNALPLRLDGDIPNLGRFAACRRVARTIYLGSAPTATAADRGVEDRRVRLGCMMPGRVPRESAQLNRARKTAALSRKLQSIFRFFGESLFLTKCT